MNKKLDNSTTIKAEDEVIDLVDELLVTDDDFVEKQLWVKRTRENLNKILTHKALHQHEKQVANTCASPHFSQVLDSKKVKDENLVWLSEWLSQKQYASVKAVFLDESRNWKIDLEWNTRLSDLLCNKNNAINLIEWNKRSWVNLDWVIWFSDIDWEYTKWEILRTDVKRLKVRIRFSVKLDWKKIKEIKVWYVNISNKDNLWELLETVRFIPLLEWTWWSWRPSFYLLNRKYIELIEDIDETQWI